MRLVKGVIVAASAVVLAATAACSGTGQPAAPASNSGGAGSYG